LTKLVSVLRHSLGITALYRAAIISPSSSEIGLAGKRRKGKHRTGKCRKNHQIGEYRKGKCRKAGRRNIKWRERKISKGNCRI
jgi:hypothetical protein